MARTCCPTELAGVLGEALQRVSAAVTTTSSRFRSMTARATVIDFQQNPNGTIEGATTE